MRSFIRNVVTIIPALFFLILLNAQAQTGPSSGYTTRTLPQIFIIPSTATSVTFNVYPNANNGAGGTWQAYNGFAAPYIYNAGQNPTATVTPLSGYAYSPQLTLNGNAGTFTVQAVDSNNTLLATFDITATPCTSGPLTVTLNSDSVTETPGELRYSVDHACAGSTISLSNVSGTITLTNRIRIDDSLTITGPGIISGNNATRLFFIGNGNVSLSNLTLQNGFGQGGNGGIGGAGMGGGIYQNGGSLTISAVMFNNNTAHGGGGTGDPHGGGGIGGNAGANGGGSGGDLFGIGGAFVLGGNGGNGGPGAGGGFGVQGNGGNGGFGGGAGSGDEYGGNGGFGGGGGAPGTGGFGGGSNGGGGAGFGGAIFQYAGTLSLSDDQFTNNTASGGSGAQNGQGKGGAIFIYAGAGAVATATNVTFSDSTAAEAGQNFIGSGSDAGYSNNAGCPGEDDVNICGQVFQFDVPSTSSYGANFAPTVTSGGYLSLLSGPCSLPTPES